MINQLIFMGAPGSGKGTQTLRLAKELNLPNIDTGSMLRAVSKEDTELGRTVKELIDAGKLAPIEIVAKVIKERLMKADLANGFILDGYPRSTEQALILEDILKELNEGKEVNLKVINIDIDINILIERLINRRTCKKCGKIYNLKFAPPKNPELCDDCQEELVQRKDDTKETATVRMETYKKETEPLINFYKERNLLFNVNGDQDIDKVYGEIKAIINN